VTAGSSPVVAMESTRDMVILRWAQPRAGWIDHSFAAAVKTADCELPSRLAGGADGASGRR
jgi:hypothetical protein